MRPHERKIGLIMIECRRRPGLKVVTFQAIVAELSRNMIRFGDRCKTALMTAITFGRGGESGGSVTGFAIIDVMPAFESEGGSMGETHSLPFAGIHGMTFLAIERKSDISMRRIGSPGIIAEMTGFTFNTQIGVLFIRMTTLAIDLSMRTNQGKSGAGMMYLHPVIIQPTLR